ncbi:MAG: hypothetical protein LBF65_03595 [Holosporales bacterium]|jgi:hypothetical protein|nr:hypothetical protein [Holosporales bacterium]
MKRSPNKRILTTMLSAVMMASAAGASMWGPPTSFVPGGSGYPHGFAGRGSQLQIAALPLTNEKLAIWLSKPTPGDSMDERLSRILLGCNVWGWNALGERAVILLTNPLSNSFDFVTRDLFVALQSPDPIVKELANYIVHLLYLIGPGFWESPTPNANLRRLTNDFVRFYTQNSDHFNQLDPKVGLSSYLYINPSLGPLRFVHKQPYCSPAIVVRDLQFQFPEKFGRISDDDLRTIILAATPICDPLNFVYATFPLPNTAAFLAFVGTTMENSAYLKVQDNIPFLQICLKEIAGHMKGDESYTAGSLQSLTQNVIIRVMSRTFQKQTDVQLSFLAPQKSESQNPSLLADKEFPESCPRYMAPEVLRSPQYSFSPDPMHPLYGYPTTFPPYAAYPSPQIAQFSFQPFTPGYPGDRVAFFDLSQTPDAFATQEKKEESQSRRDVTEFVIDDQKEDTKESDTSVVSDSPTPK